MSNGGPAGTVAIGDPRLASNVRIRRGLEGPQLIVEWDVPAQVSTEMQIRVVRKQFEFAASPFDPQGTVVFEGPADAGFVADLDLEACKCWYYTVFTHEFFPAEKWLFSVDTQVAEIAVATGFFGRDAGLFNRLPEIYVLEDKMLDLDAEERAQSFFALSPVFDAEGREWFNLGENTDPSREPVKKGPLQRFLKTIALDLDLTKGLIDCMPTLWDVDETCCDVLPALGEVIGLQVNRELPCSAQRQEIKEHVAILKVKGTTTALRARARSVSGFETAVQEWGGNILLTNREGRTTIASPNSGLDQRFRMPGDDTDYTPGGDIGPQSVSIFFLLECDDCLPEQVVRKLNRVIPPELPACHPGHLIFMDCVEVDEYDRSRLDDGFEDLLEDQFTEDVRQKCWLYTNGAGPQSFRGRVGRGRVGVARAGSAGGPFTEDVTNSVRAQTASEQMSAVCFEAAVDEVTLMAAGRINRARINVSRIGDG